MYSKAIVVLMNYLGLKHYNLQYPQSFQRERDHNAESNTHNLVQLASAAAKYLGYKDFCSYLKTNSSGIKRASQICL